MANIGAKRQQISDELERLEESARDSAQGQFAQASRWRRLNFTVGVPTSALAAASGATGLASTTGRVWAGVLALAAAVTGSILTTINAGHRWAKAASAANAYLEIQTAARQVRLIDLPDMDIDEARQQLAELTSRRDEQNKTAEIIAPPAWRQARKASPPARRTTPSTTAEPSYLPADQTSVRRVVIWPAARVGGANVTAARSVAVLFHIYGRARS